MSRNKIIIGLALAASVFAAVTLFAARSHGAKKPAASEFGFGPRLSAQGLYVATLDADEGLKPRKMYTIRATVTDANGQAVTDAVIDVDGGMPEHGHGFPTRPRVTKNLGGGQYEIGGLRFNMGGWWELKLIVKTPAGTDTVTFNLSL